MVKEPSTLGFTVCVPHVFQFPCILFLTDAIQALLQFWGSQYKVFDPNIVLDKVASVKSSYISIHAHIDPVRQSGKELGFISQLSYMS
jgi:hypothetical protein